MEFFFFSLISPSSSFLFFLWSQVNTGYFKELSSNTADLKPAGEATSGDMEKEQGPAGCLPRRTESKPEEMTAQADLTHSGWGFLPPFVTEPSPMALPGFKLGKLC